MTQWCSFGCSRPIAALSPNVLRYENNPTPARPMLTWRPALWYWFWQTRLVRGEIIGGSGRGGQPQVPRAGHLSEHRNREESLDRKVANCRWRETSSKRCLLRQAPEACTSDVPSPVQVCGFRQNNLHSPLKRLLLLTKMGLAPGPGCPVPVPFSETQFVEYVWSWKSLSSYPRSDK